MGQVVKPVASLFGLGPDHDEYYQNKNEQADRYTKFLSGIDSEQRRADAYGQDQLASGAAGNLYRGGGLNDRLDAEEKQLAGQGFDLTQDDHTAYGQTAGNVARLFGQQEGDASKALARRGLGSANSGAAGAAFSGLAGNKNEMLAKAQTDIAQKRYQDTSNRLQQTRNQMQSLGLQGQSMANSIGENVLNNKSNAFKDAYKVERDRNAEGRQEQEDRKGAKTKTIGDAWSEGTYSGMKSGTADSTASWASMGGSGAMGMSDENNKTNVQDGTNKIRGFLDEVHGPADYSSEKPSGGSSGGGSGGMSSLLGDSGGKSGGGGMGGMLGGLFGMMSDENCKTNIQDGSPKIRGFLDSVQPNSYEYKDESKGNPLAGEGEFVSPMAQELEQTELGADMVQDTPDGKVVDYGKGFGTILAAQADLNARLKALEGNR